ncbi:MAG: hypothetical protein LBD67_05575 [Candidatus Accumulibacter sp.]|nr:hypothetical protein [Accumulibacter sp.]
MLSVSKYERTRQGLSKASLISLLRQIQGKRVLDLSSPYPSTTPISVRAEPVEV